MAMQRGGTGRHADHAHRGIRARQGALHAHRLCAHRGEGQQSLSAIADHRAHPQPVQRRRSDTADRKRRLARRGSIEIHPTDAESRGINEGDWVGIGSRAGQTVLRARVTERVAPGVVYTTFHFPESGANVITTDNSDWATNCPEYKVTAVEVSRVYHPSEWQKRYQAFSDEQQRLLTERRQARTAGTTAEVRR